MATARQPGVHLPPFARPRGFLRDIKFWLKLLAQIVVEAGGGLGTRAYCGWILGGDLAAPFRIQLTDCRAHCIEFDLASNDEHHRTDTLKRPHDKLPFGVDEPYLTMLPLPTYKFPTTGLNWNE